MKEELITKRVDFGLIRYANCWEDPEILLSGLNPHKNARILSVGSAGDNSFSLLLSHPDKIVAIDLSYPQLYLIELKKVACKHLSYDSLLGFLGFTSCNNRWDLYLEISGYLSEDSRKYWNLKRSDIQRGVVHTGKFEKYFSVFRKYLLPLAHSRKESLDLIAPKSLTDQKRFYDEVWNNWRYRLLFRFFFSEKIMGFLGRDPEFFNEVKVNVADYIISKTKKYLTENSISDNEFLAYILTGEWSILPHYLRPENYEIIKNQIDKVEIKYGFAEDQFLEDSYDLVNFSNIFEYIHRKKFQEITLTLANRMKPGTRVAYWNLMVPRFLSVECPQHFLYLKNESERLNSLDKGFFYRRFIIEERTEYGI